MVGEEFKLPLRVYIEDTDAGGIVYYVNYLKYMERARTEFLRAMGFGKDYWTQRGLMFVVRDVALTYLRPARLDDPIEATVQVREIRGATMSLQQTVSRGADVLVEGRVTVVCVDYKLVQPRRVPEDICDWLENWSANEIEGA